MVGSHVRGPRVRDLMQTSVVVVDPEDNAAEVEGTLVKRGIGGAPVVSDGKLVGVISRSDILKRLVVGQSLAEAISDYYRDYGLAGEAVLPVQDPGFLQQCSVRKMMADRLITVEPDTDVGSAAQLMLEHGIHRVLVVEGSKLVGIVTSFDLLRLLSDSPWSR